MQAAVLSGFGFVLVMAVLVEWGKRNDAKGQDIPAALIERGRKSREQGGLLSSSWVKKRDAPGRWVVWLEKQLRLGERERIRRRG